MPAKKHFGEPCSIDGCDRVAARKTWCTMHYQRSRSHGAPDAPVRERLVAASETCSLDGCDRAHEAKGLCYTHYARLRLNGAAGPSALLRAENGAGHLNRDGYRLISHAGKFGRQEHRVVMESILGRPLLRHETVHHLNGQRADNRPENLELWSSAQPAGQRVVDKLEWAKEIIALYGNR